MKPLFGKVAKLIDGRRDAPAIAGALLDGARPEQVLAVLSCLEDWGFLDEDSLGGGGPVAWRGRDRDPVARKLLALLDGPLEALVDLSPGAGGEVYVYAGISPPSDMGPAAEGPARDPARGADGSTEMPRGREIVAGRGLTRRQAIESCLGEAAERLSATFRDDDPLVRARYTNLADRALHPDRLLNFSARQYAGRDRWNARRAGHNWIPFPFDENGQVGWVEAQSLRRGDGRLIPAAYCYLDYPGDPGVPCFCVANSSGCASAGTLEEAAVRGFLELVERDAAAIWWYGRIRRPAVDLDCFADERIAAFRDWMAAQGRQFFVLDLTHDLSVPVFAAVSADLDGGRIVFGLGADFDPLRAAQSAMTEMEQFSVSADLIEANRDQVPEDALDPSARMFGHWLATATLATEPHFVAAADAKTRYDRNTAGEPPHADRRLEHLQRLSDERHLNPLVMDLTRADFGLPTARVVVPGLRHFWARFGPGRLYDVPLRLGWLTEAMSETALNPTPLFI